MNNRGRNNHNNKLHELTENVERAPFLTYYAMIKIYCDHRHLKLLEKLQSEQGPRWMNRWVLEQKRKQAKEKK